MEYTYKWQEAFAEVANGNRKFLDEHISNVYHEHLFPIVLTKTKSEDLAHEICSATIEKFWKKFYLKKDTLPDNVNGYLYTMAKNALYHFTKMRQKERAVIGALEETKIRDIVEGSFSTNDFGESNETENMYQALNTAWSQLGERCRELLNLNFIKKKTIRAIAPLMNFPTENAATQKKVSCLKGLKKLAYFEIHKLENL